MSWSSCIRRGYLEFSYMYNSKYNVSKGSIGFILWSSQSIYENIIQIKLRKSNGFNVKHAQ